MNEVKPFIKCVDYWPGYIPPEKQQIYKAMIKEGQIIKHQVLFNSQTYSTIIVYSSIAPHEWILQQMKERAEKNA